MAAWPEGGAGRMFSLIEALPRQLAESASLPGLDAIEPSAGDPPARVVLCGMGGSAIAGDLTEPLLTTGTTALTVWRDYGLPPWVGPDDTVILSSYSGATEETLAAADAAAKRGCRRLAITTGGELAAQAAAAGFQTVQLPPGLPPRASLGYGLGALLRVLVRLGCLAEVDSQLAEAVAYLQGADESRRHPIGTAAVSGPADPDGNLPCAELAGALRGRVPVIYSAGGEAHGVALRWKAQLNENGKTPALAVAFPELNHNDLVGWCLPADLRERFVLLILRGRDDNDRGALRVDVTRRLLAGQFAATHEIRARAPGSLTRILALVQYGDYLSCHLAHQSGVDPVPVERIDALKQALASADQIADPENGRQNGCA